MGLAAGRGSTVRTLTGCLVWALPVAVPGSKCCASCLSAVGSRICCRVGCLGDVPVEVLFPEGRERFELGSSGWSQVLGIDAVGGPPQCDFADEGGARVTSRWCPDWLGVTLAGVVLYLVGEVDDKLGSVCQIVAPEGIGMEHWWNAPKPGQRTRVGRRERCETPVEDGRHVACGSEIASAGGYQQVSERVFSGFGRKGDQVGSQRWPGGFSCESGDVLVGLVELCDRPGSDKLFGCEVEAVGVALDRLEKPGRWIVELAQHGAGGDRRLIAGKDLLQRLSRRAR